MQTLLNVLASLLYHTLFADFNVTDNAEKYFSFLIYGEIPTSAVIGQNYSFTVNVDLSGVSYTFQQNVTASDVAVPQAVC